MNINASLRESKLDGRNVLSSYQVVILFSKRYFVDSYKFVQSVTSLNICSDFFISLTVIFPLDVGLEVIIQVFATSVIVFVTHFNDVLSVIQVFAIISVVLFNIQACSLTLLTVEDNSFGTSITVGFCIFTSSCAFTVLITGAELKVGLILILFCTNSIGLTVYVIAFSFHNQAFTAEKKSRLISIASLKV